MPYKSRKVRNKNCYKVYKNDKTKKVFAKCATKENAQRQMRLLRAIQNNKNFKPNARRNMGGKSRKNKTLKKKGGRSTASGPNAFRPPPLVSGNYIQIGTGEIVNIFDTTSTLQSQEYNYVQHTLQSPITGVIVSQAGGPYSQYYHMVVTTGNGQIQAGTHLYLDMNLYNANSHIPITRDRDTSNEEKDGPENGPGNGPLIVMGGKSKKIKTLKIKGGLPPPQVVEEQLHSGNYVKLNIGDRVNFIDTNNYTNQDGSVTNFLSQYGAVIEDRLYRENMEIIGDGPIEGYIVGMALRPPRAYYHMVVTKGNNMIGVGLHFHLDTNNYNTSTHGISNPSRSTSLPFP